ncbi:MAG: hypothetical protein Q8P67_02735, partial [archaeon]|nr:hypothetical protein [archaeon]
HLTADQVKAFVTRFGDSETLELARRDISSAVQRVEQGRTELTALLRHAEAVEQKSKVTLQSLRMWKEALQRCALCFTQASTLLDEISTQVGNKTALYPQMAADPKFRDYFRSLLEVYRVSKRIHSSLQRSPKPELDVLLATLPEPHPLHILRDLAKTLSLVVSKLEIWKIPHLLPWKDIHVPKDTPSLHPRYCALCAVPFDSYERTLQHKEQPYHPECANFQVNLLNP